MENKTNITNSCGQQGCSAQPYILPNAGTSEEFRKLVEEKEKQTNKKFNK